MNITFNQDINSSKLYHLAPIHGKDVLQESLTGYIARLAQKHLMDVTQLMKYELAPVLKKEYLNRIAAFGGTRFYNSASMLNSVGEAALEFTAVLQELTLRTDLLQCTLFPWHHVIPSRNLISPIKKWCPLCYEDFLNEGTEVYEPLLWSFQCVSACPIHEHKLLTQCPFCKKELRILDRYSQPGVCTHCKQWLGGKGLSEAASCEEAVIAKQVVSLLAMDPGKSDSKYIGVFLKQCTDQLSGGIAGLARLLEFPKTTVWDWYKGKNLPAFPQLLQLCRKVNVDISEVLFENQKRQIKLPTQAMPIIAKKQNRHKIDQEELKQELDTCSITQNEPASMRSVARTIKIPRKAVERYFSDKCKYISKRYVSHINCQAITKKEQRKAEIHKICEILMQQGIFPSRRNVEKLASWKAALRNPELQMEWKQIVYGPSGYSPSLV